MPVIDTPNTELNQLLSLEAIRNLRVLYCHHLDSGRIDSLTQLFTEDAILQVDRGCWRGRAEIKAGLSDAFAEYDPQQRGAYPFVHLVSNPWVELLDENRAEGRCHMQFLLTERAVEENPLILMGVYADEYVRVDGQWLISRTRLDVIWPKPDVAGGEPGNGLVLPS
ncbi:nuclear transport factor 2 family protein [Pseudomonas sp. NA-150]|uniref:nuclear transport factor 2 family protein n=1 Tax=Pseudomonas sp. NA-150 TaxID=3367525 RepID=UPI0037C50C75